MTPPRSSWPALLAILILLAFSPAALAQTGTIAGVVIDGDTGDTMIGANVSIEGTMIGTTTGIDGDFQFKADVGTYTVLFSFIGYNPVRVQNVEVLEGEVTRLEVTMNFQTEELSEIIVEARALQNTEASLLSQRAKADAVSDAISAEAISRSGSSNAADAMEKVTGASVVGGKYVYVRGLGDRYSSTQLNGVDLPSSDPDRKAVQFDIFPSNLLDNIVTIKTFTPDKPGNFSGGLVDIATKAFPDELTFQLSTSYTYNTQTTFQDDFLSYIGGDSDWTASDDGARDIPEILQDPTTEIPTEVPARRNEELANQLDQFSNAFNNTYTPIVKTAPINQSYALSLGNNTNLFGNQFGYIVGVTYSNSASFYDDGRTERYSATGGGGLSPDLLFTDQQATEEAALGLLANLTYRLGANNEIGFNTVYSRNGESMTRFQFGQSTIVGIEEEDALVVSRSLAYTERELQSFQVRGEHFLPGLLGATFEWKGALADTRQDEPDRRFVGNTEETNDDGEKRFGFTGAGIGDPDRYYRTLDENSVNAKGDITIPLKMGARAAEFKFGGAYQQADRNFTERFIEVVIDPSIRFEGETTLAPGGDTGIADYFAQENFGITGVNERPGRPTTYSFGHVVRDATKQRNNYDGDREIAAGYAMLTLPITDAFRVIGGARLETTNISIVSQDESAPVGEIDETDILPSLNLVYALRDNMNLRVAGSQTLARPTFREIAPFSAQDFLLGEFIIGNPELQRSLIQNYDLRWEWFTRPGEILAVSGFLKNLENPIERAFLSGGNGQITFRNVPEATVAGLELEARTSLDRLSPALASFSLGLNATFVQSSIDIPGEFDDNGNLVGGELFVRNRCDLAELGQCDLQEETRELQGQSPFLINGDLSYENYEADLSAGIYFNVFGERLSNVSDGVSPDIFEQPSPQLDLTFSKGFRNGFQVKVSAKNLLDAPFEEIYNFDDPERDYLFQRYERGHSFSLGLSYSL
ncbi:MAG: TonB-dependent receptor [Bacteroidota bacterium]